VYDTLVNPLRPVAATEIHGITDSDVKGAPTFRDISGDLVSALRDCVIASYNIYFDIRFLNFEFTQTGISQIPPHFCLMYLRPMLNLGNRCKLEDACRFHSIEYEVKHVAAYDAQASAVLLEYYFEIMSELNISNFSDLASLKKYKFIESFYNDPLPDPSLLKLTPCNRVLSRSGFESQKTLDEPHHALCQYWDALKCVLSDLEITDEEIDYIMTERRRLNLTAEQIRVLHARVFSSAISQYTDDEWLDDQEARKLQRLHYCLSKLGWAPGQ
jgi:DNA polymerase III epsilon subunit-like protein